VRLSATRLFPLLLMLALALLSLWLEQAVRREEVLHPSLRRHDPDFVVDNLLLTRYNPQGAPESTLAAAKMIHYPDDGSTELLSPRVVQSKPNEPRLTVSADRGALSQDGEEVFLYGDVLLVRESHAGRPETRFRTTFLHLVRARSILRTDREVQVVDERRVLSGRGMEYHNDSRQLLLRGRVRGRFEPKRQGRDIATVTRSQP
jgi:lipopolysaccharide export system protein LptC